MTRAIGISEHRSGQDPRGLARCASSGIDPKTESTTSPQPTTHDGQLWDFIRCPFLQSVRYLRGPAICYIEWYICELHPAWTVGGGDGIARNIGSDFLCYAVSRRRWLFGIDADRKFTIFISHPQWFFLANSTLGTVFSLSALIPKNNSFMNN